MIQRPLQTLTIVATGSSENLVTIYQSTRCYMTEDMHIKQTSLAKIKSHKRDSYLSFTLIPEIKAISRNTWHNAEFHGKYR